MKSIAKFIADYREFVLVVAVMLTIAGAAFIEGFRGGVQ